MNVTSPDFDQTELNDAPAGEVQHPGTGHEYSQRVVPAMAGTLAILLGQNPVLQSEQRDPHPTEELPTARTA